MSGEPPKTNGPLAGKAIYADPDDPTFRDVEAVVTGAGGRITGHLEDGLYAIVNRDTKAQPWFDHAVANGIPLITPEDAVTQIRAEIERTRPQQLFATEPKPVVTVAQQAAPRPPGMYDDPSQPGKLRYWDGMNWAQPQQPGAPTQ